MAGSGGDTAGVGPAVSVVMPVRDCLAYVPFAISGIEAQGIPDVELVAVDCGSTDGTCEWLEAKSRSASWLTVLRSRDESVDTARNLGIAAARAPLVAFLDADDLWLPGKLHLQLASHVADPELVFSFTDYLHHSPDGRGPRTCFERSPVLRRTVRSATAGDSAYRRLACASGPLLAGEVIATSTVVARRNALQNAGGFEASLRSVSDWDLWLRLARSGPVAFTPRLGARHVGPPKAAGSDIRLRVARMRWILEAHASRVPADVGCAGAVRLARANLRAAEAELARVEGRQWAAVVADLHALLSAPSPRLGRAVMADLLRIAGKAREPAHP